MDRAVNLYDILEVSPGASPRQIQIAYRRLAKLHHPDANPGDPGAAERFKRISAAYRVLSDPAARRNYDRTLASAASPPPSGPGYNSASAGISTRNIKIRLYLSLEEACRGGVRKLKFPRHAVCLVCGGAGRDRTGAACSACQSRGYVVVDHSSQVRYEPGVRDGETIRLPGEGHADVLNATPGDVLVTVTFKAHPYFTVQGADLHYSAVVTLEEYLEGTTVKVPTITGSTMLEVPPRFPDGGVFRLPGRGLPGGAGRPAGDIVVTIRHCVPRKLSSRERGLLRELQKLPGFRPPTDANGFVPRDSV